MNIRKLNFFYLLIVYFIPTFLFSQNYIITGFIRDGNSNEALPFVNIYIPDINYGITSDEKGKYTISLKPGNYDITVSYIGYRKESIPLKIDDKNIFLNIKLFATDYLLQSVTVYSTIDSINSTAELSSVALQSERIGQMSAVFRDVFRSIQTLPGISTNNELSAKFNVRGGNYDENLVLVNGAVVYEPFHIKEATYASVGIFNTDLMKKVDLITGGFSAEFGDKMSSVLNIQYREGDKEKYKFMGSFSLASLDILAEGPLFTNSSFIFAFRKSYFEYLMSYFDVDERIHPALYDAQGTISYRLSSKNKILLQFIHSGDNYYYSPFLNSWRSSYSGSYKSKPANFVYSENQSNEKKADYYSNLFDIQSINYINDKILLKAEISYYHQSEMEYSIDTSSSRRDIYSVYNYFDLTKWERSTENHLSIKTLEGRLSMNFQINPDYELKAGLSYINIFYDQVFANLDRRITMNNIDKFPDTIIKSNINNTEEARNEIRTSSYKFNSYLENVLQLSDRFILNIGGRIDYFDINRQLTFSPRAGFAFRTDFGITFRGAWGSYFQSPVYNQLLYSFSADSNTKSQKANHYIFGIERFFLLNEGNSLTLKLEAFYKKYNDLISSNRSSYWRINYSRKNDAVGFAQGIDLYLALAYNDFYGWISYGLLSTEEDILNDKISGYPRYTDQTHTLSLVMDYNLGKEWTINTRIFYGSGYAYTPYHANYISSQKRWEWIQEEQNSGYLPFYKRIDLRLSKNFRFDGFDMFVYLDVTNLFNFSNVMSYRYTFNQDGYPKRDEIKLFPIIPSIGLTIKL